MKIQTKRSKSGNGIISTDLALAQVVVRPERDSNFYITEFLSFLDDDLAGATAELGKLQDSNRIHIQKLIFTNMIDRFDYAIDKALLSLVNHAHLRELLLKDMKEPVTDRKLFDFLLKAQDNLKTALRDVMQNELRGSVLRQRHSKKLSHLSQILMPNVNLQHNRVNVATGKILTKTKYNKKIPVSILGYADWLYCRRNAVVHGGGSMKVSTGDTDHLKSTFKIVEPAESVKLNLGSINNAANFYRSLIALFDFY